MAFKVSRYVDPGVYISEVIEPGSVAISSERTLAIVATAPRTRRSQNEAVVRGKVYNEALSSFPLTTPFVHSLVNVSDRNKNNAVLYMNGNKLGIADWEFVSAKLTGSAVAGATVDTSTGKNVKLTVSIDGKKPITITLPTGVAVALGPAATAGTIAHTINDALVASSVYGASYGSVASTITTTVADDTLVLISPSTTPDSDVKLFLSYEDVANTYNDAANLVSGGSWNPTKTSGVQSSTIIVIIDAIYQASATYKIDYVTVQTPSDPLTYATTETPLDSITNVGSFPGVSSYTNNRDYHKDTNNVDWTTSLSAQATISSIDGTFDISSSNNKLLLAINDGVQLTVTLPTGGTVSAAAVAEAINLALSGSADYGPAFAYTASVSGLKVVLTAPSQFQSYPLERGEFSSFDFYDVTNSAFETIFGTSYSLPLSVAGVGKRPTFGTQYYASYDYVRPDSDYEMPQKVYNPDQMYGYTSPITIGNYTRNKLAIAGEIAWENGAPALWLMQINDSTSPGSPTPSQITAAITACSEKAGITDIVVLDTSLNTAVALMNHVSDMSSMFEKKYRRGWYGMERDTDVGDPDSPDTFVYRAVRTLQPGSTSPGRGRHILVSPPNVSRTLTLEDGREVTVELDSTYTATAIAALFTSLPSSSDTLMNKSIRGFDIETFQTYLRGERFTLAGNGVTVVTQDAGNFKLIDPLTTEAGGGKLPQFEEISASSQKDAVTRKVEILLDQNVKGIVPSDVDDFLADIKKWIMLGVISAIEAGDCAHYRNSSGQIRDIDPASDIQVFQSTTDPRTFYFRYWYNLLYPAKRFFGEYSVDNPFFTVA